MSILAIMAAKLGMRPHLGVIIMQFLIYSFMGYIMECTVVSFEKRRLILSRGFVRHLPFCIIYGFGAMIGFVLLKPFSGNLVILFFVGALAATAFEFFVAKIQLKCFGEFWWNYKDKPLNYKGIICLESTIGWGFISLFIIKFFHIGIIRIVTKIPMFIITPVAISLLVLYILDFSLTSYEEKTNKKVKGVNPDWSWKETTYEFDKQEG